MSEVLSKHKYLDFEQVQPAAGAKMPTYRVTNKKGGYLGDLKFHGAWRRYVYHTLPHIILDGDCLREIAFKLGVVTQLWQAEQKLKRDQMRMGK